MNNTAAGYEAYLDFLRSLRESGAEYFVEGGQAVNFWAEHIDSRIRTRPLHTLRPFTSKDCDLWVSHHTWEQLKRSPGGKLRKGTSPADGQLGILTLRGKPPLVIDVMSTVYGIPAKDYPRLLDRVLDDGIMRVIDPLYLFLSKCHCLLGLDQTDRQDERHVRMLALILPEYLILLIEDADTGKLDDRPLLKEIKLLRKISSTSTCRRAMQLLGIDAESLIPWARLESSHSERLVKFARRQRKDEASD